LGDAVTTAKEGEAKRMNLKKGYIMRRMAYFSRWENEKKR